MEPNTGYVITEQNIGLIAMISGNSHNVLKANIGWAAVYEENPYPRWSLMPKNLAEERHGFEWVDSSLNGLPARTVKEIRKDWAQVNAEYSKKLNSLTKELERAELRDGVDNGG